MSAQVVGSPLRACSPRTPVLASPSNSLAVKSLPPDAFKAFGGPKVQRQRVPQPPTDDAHNLEQEVRALSLELARQKQELLKLRETCEAYGQELRKPSVEVVCQSAVEQAVSNARKVWESRFKHLEESVSSAVSKEAVTRSEEVQNACAGLETVLRKAISSAVESDRQVHQKNLAETHAAMITHGTYVTSRLEESASFYRNLLEQAMSTAQAAWESRFKNLEETVSNAVSKEAATRSEEVQHACAGLEIALREAILSAVESDREVTQKQLAATHAAMVTHGTYVVSRLEELTSSSGRREQRDKNSRAKVQALRRALREGRAQTPMSTAVLDIIEEDSSFGSDCSDDCSAVPTICGQPTHSQEAAGVQHSEKVEERPDTSIKPQRPNSVEPLAAKLSTIPQARAQTRGKGPSAGRA